MLEQSRRNAMTSEAKTNGWTTCLVQAPSAWLDGYQALSSASLAIMNRWIKHRAAQFRSNLDTCTRLAACKDTAEVAKAQQRWVRDSIDNLSAEITEYQDQMVALSQEGFWVSRGDKSSRSGDQRPRVEAA
jgi:hypothetical protein